LESALSAAIRGGSKISTVAELVGEMRPQCHIPEPMEE
jgi:hypothetical protein